MVDDALELGIKHAAINVNLAQIVDPSDTVTNPKWRFEGRTYFFHQNALQRLDRSDQAPLRQGRGC